MDNGLRYLVVAKDIVNDEKFWLFERNEKFEQLLQQWKDNSPKK